MFDPYNPNDLHMAQQYEDELFAYEREHPHVGKGMSVEVYNGAEVCCEGRILRMEWYDKYNLYVCEVLVEGSTYYIFSS